MTESPPDLSTWTYSHGVGHDMRWEKALGHGLDTCRVIVQPTWDGSGRLKGWSWHLILPNVFKATHPGYYSTPELAKAAADKISLVPDARGFVLNG